MQTGRRRPGIVEKNVQDRRRQIGTAGEKRWPDLDSLNDRLAVQ